MRKKANREMEKKRKEEKEREIEEKPGETMKRQRLRKE